MFSIEEPGYLLLFLVFPAAIWFRHFYRGRGGVLPLPIGVYNGPGAAARLRIPKAAQVLSGVGFWLGSACLVIAIAGPTIAVRERIFLTRGIDMMVVLDESPSMAAQDFQPGNRFEVAREVIRRFVRSRENDPVGLVSFGKEAALRVPLTLDYDYIEERISDLRIMDLGDGTAIGMGLAVACVHLRSSTAREKVIILITDGENNMGEISPETAAEVAAHMGIRIYAIGIGGTEEAPLEFTDPASGKTYRGTFQGGFDEGLIRTLAARSGGAYFHAGSPGALAAVFHAIDSVERTDQRARIQVRTAARHESFLLAGLVLILADFFLRKLWIGEAM